MAAPERPRLHCPPEFDAEGYRAAVLKRFEHLNFEMFDTTGAFYSPVRRWSVFVPQSVRECHEYNPRLLEIPKEHQKRMLDAGEITAKELEEAEKDADQRRKDRSPVDFLNIRTKFVPSTFDYRRCNC